MNWFSIFALLLPYIEEIAPHAQNILGIILPIIPQIASGMLHTSFEIAGVTISAYSKTGTPVKLTFSDVIKGLENYIEGEQAQIECGDIILTVTPKGVAPVPPALPA